MLVSASGVCALVAFSALALAQNPPDVECRKTETQPECHARLKCKVDEELGDCQKRLLKCRADEQLEDCKKRVGAEPAKEGNAGQRDDAKGRDREPDQRGRDREPDQGGRDREPDQRGRDREPDQAGGESQRRDEGATPRRQRGERRGGRGFQANKTFGLGLELGEPTGLNGKYFLSTSGALDFGIGEMFSPYYYGQGFHIYADYLWHPTSLVSAPAFELPFYVGAGLRFWDFDYCYQGVCNYGGSAIGIRVPVGIALDFNNVPLDIFVQLVPVVDFLAGNYYDRYGDRAHLGIDLSAGIRYWFK